MKQPIPANLWTKRTVQETRALYAGWAADYDADMARMAYATPRRIASALVSLGPSFDAPILDFGCGTGLSGAALRDAGFTTIDGTDISPEMLDHARTRRHGEAALYRALWLGEAGLVRAAPGDYPIIVATGVISLGAAPPDMLDVLLAALAPGGLLAFSFNDPTLASPEFTGALDAVLAQATARLMFREHGPHLNDKVTGSDVIVLRKA